MKILSIKLHSVYKAIALVALLALFTSCNTARLTSSWSLPGASAHKYQKVLVIGVTGARDREIRESIEDAVVKKLNDYHINAQAAASKYGPHTFQDISDEQATKLVKDDGFDAVLIVALLDKNKEEYYTSGTISRTPYAIVRSRWSNNYRVLYARVYTPGYYTTSTNYELEANFYDTAQNELQYSSQVKSFYPGTTGFQAGDFSQSIMNDMIKKGIIIK